MHIGYTYLILICIIICIGCDNTQADKQSYHYGDFAYDTRYQYDVNGDFLIEKGGNMLFYNQPTGAYYHGRNSRTYLSWMNNSGVVRLTYYDHRTKKMSLFSNIHKWNYIDDHAQPSIHIKRSRSKQGHLLIALALHNSPLYITTSNEPESIIGFSPLQLIDSGRCTYPTIIENNRGELMIFYNKNIYNTTPELLFTRSIFYKESIDGGVTWSDEKMLITPNNGEWLYYVRPKNTGDTIHLCFSVKKPGADIVKDVYYVVSNNWGRSWLNLEKTVLPDSIDKLAPVYKSSNDIQTRAWDIQLDGNKSPIIAFQNYDKNGGTAYTTNLISEPILAATTKQNHYPGGIVLDQKNPRKIYVAEWQGNTSYIFSKTLSDKQYVITDTIATNSKHLQMRPQIIENANTLKLLWIEEISYLNIFDFNTNLKGYIQD